ncbi:tRNA-splicing endonuclease [Aeropyrum pernix]|uniref:tRNA-splicing endonuclease n=1 Tax=Aeropyrum pernix TaxID=56636 RepID=A0A401HBL9_AERPX|nr:tRNA-intron lyase [Aeropyrum pernix]GBF09780.1 tRNA-splicing endonuclease [Aeropyrum pernix]
MLGDRCALAKASGVLIGDSVLVTDVEEARSLYSCGYYGQPLDVEKPRGADFEGPLRLSLIESLYLAEKGVLEVVKPDGSSVGVEDLRTAVRGNPRFSMLYNIYRDLRERGFVVRSGLKFGSDFAVYRLGPGIDHAPFIVHAYSPEDNIDPVEIVRAGRLSHSVRKKFVFAVSRGGDVSYLMIDWFRP